MLKVYHGVSPCEMLNKEKEKLIADYQNASEKEKKLLELRYGKRQIKLIVEETLTNNYLKVIIFFFNFRLFSFSFYK